MAPRDSLRKTKEAVPDMPKRPVTTFIRFKMDEYQKFKETNKEWDSVKLKNEFSKMWETLDEKKKKKYEDAYEKENEKFKKDLK